MLRTLIEKVDNMQEQVDNVSRELEILRKITKEMLEMKNTGTEKKSFDRPISTLDTAKERIFDLFDMTIGTPQTEKQRHLKMKAQETEELWDSYKRYNCCGNTKRSKRERNRHNYYMKQ